MKSRPTGLQILCLVFVTFLAHRANAETVFIEAETMQTSSDGWVATENSQTRRASRTRTLWGATGPGDAVATKTVQLGEAGRYRIWVRYLHVAAWRGPFEVGVVVNDNRVASKTFDQHAVPDLASWEYTWQSFDVDLSAGDVTLTLSKHEQKNASGYVRHVDCMLLTTDHELVPDHLPYGPQTRMRVTIGEGYDRPIYMHLFADHYRAPWYAHYAIGRDGIRQALAPPAAELLQSGDVTPWCDLTPTVYQDSGAALNFSVRHSYHEPATTFRAKLEFGRPRNGASQSDDIEVIKTFDVQSTPNGLVIIAPPNLETADNIALLKRDAEFAEEVGKMADAFEWPKHGRRPVKIPFLVSASLRGYASPVDASVKEREQRTLDYFGFNGAHERILHGLWSMKEGSYCQPDLEKMKQRVTQNVAKFRESGGQVEDIAACMLMDEPTGQSAQFMSTDKGYRKRFREWLQAKRLTPDDLLVATWDEVRPVVETERDAFPALHYYTQRFRTRALGDFMATQRKLIEEAYGHSFPTLVNFSDGATYHANFYSQGVDYFELLDADDQNAIWGEDWANGASTYQCAGFNVALMQAAARQRGQAIGHYLIAHAGRKPWDIKTKATSETARGVRIWKNFSYGPNWSSHEGGPPSRTHLWHAKPENWTANAEITREIGAVEDWLLTAKTAAAKVAVLYSSSSDIWTVQSNLAFGFDRMHTWLALAHAQTPVDIVPERELDRLDQYQVVYLSGPNLTRDAATKLRAWVEAGGTLWLSAGAAARDEFNRPLDTLTSMLPAERGELATLEPFRSSGTYLDRLKTHDTVAWGDSQLEVLSVKQSLRLVEPSLGEVIATFKEGEPAAIRGRAGKGHVFVLGFLPALSYIKPALDARRPLEHSLKQKLADAEQAAHHAATKDTDQPLATSATLSATDMLSSHEGANGELARVDRSYNPWSFPAGIRDCLLTPVRNQSITPTLSCDTPLVDAVELSCERGTLIALSNFTLQPLERVEFKLQTNEPVVRVDSVRLGSLEFESLSSGQIQFALPLEASDFVTVSTDADPPDAGQSTPTQATGTPILHGKPIRKVLFLGNSITLHGPAANIGWTGNWGMAASTAEADYVHRLIDRLTKASGAKPEVMVKNIAGFERDLTAYPIREALQQELAFEPDVILIALGENASSPKTDEAKAKFATAFASLFTELKKQGAPTIFVRSTFWHDADKDSLLKQASMNAGAIYVDIRKIGEDPKNYARAERHIEHAGVANHPGDQGMQALADAFADAIEKHAEKAQPQPK